ncbi:hypothetical protein Lal_00047439 [Lupinus albus]|nr:hypothetical protein Lal_00047439 [Lupinus albus]
MAVSAQTKPKKTVSSKKPLSHPPFAEMISDAIVSLKERTGSSQIAISKFIEEKHKDLPATFKKLLLLNLKKSVAAGKLVKVKNSFKIAPTVKASVKAASIDDKKLKTVAKPKAATVAKVHAKAAVKSKAVTKPKVKAVSAGAKTKAKIVKSPAKKVAAKPVKKAPVKSVKKPKSVKSPVKKVAAKKAKKLDPRPRVKSTLNIHRMIVEAILNLKERTGSSQYAIAKFIEEKHKDLPATFKKLILHNLKKSVAAGKLVKVKCSFKLAPTVKAVVVADSKKPKTVSKPNAKTVSKAKPKTTAKSEAITKPKAKAVSGGAKAKVKIVKSPVKKVDAKPAKKAPLKTVKKTKSVKSPVKKVAAKKAKK